MSISRKVKSEALHVHYCSPELILSFLERSCNQEDGERALIHLSNCSECRAKAVFVCQAMVAEKDGSFPLITEEERQATLLHVDELLKKHTTPTPQILWEHWISSNNILSLLKKNTFEPEVIAAGAESSELYFRSVEPRTSEYFWQAALCIEDGTGEKLKIILTNAAGEKIPSGVFLLCLIKTKVEDGVCFVNKEEFAENLFSKNAARHSVAFRFLDKTIVAGQPVLGTVL